MTLFWDLLHHHSIANAVLVLSLVAALGLGLGSVQVGKISLGIAGVLFSGIIFGHFGFTIDPNILSFIREFGLILFVFTIGMQMGPGFLSSLRKQGLQLNVMAAAIVLMGALITVVLVTIAGIPMETAVGLYCGATTNTPALGAAQEALRGISVSPTAAPPGVGYAVAYPFGILGIIASLLLLRSLFHVDATREAQAFEQEQRGSQEHIARLALRVDNPNLEGLTVQQIPGLNELGIVVSRIRPAGEQAVHPALTTRVLHCGDLILTVGPVDKLAQFRLIIGSESTEDLMQATGEVTSSRLVVTRGEVLGQSLRELGFGQIYGVTVTRITRAGLEMAARPDLKLQFGDILQVVGTEPSIQQVTVFVGNEIQELNHTRFIGVFIGLALGVFLGSLPIHFEAIPVPVKLGLAGGPLIAAIIIGRLGHLGSLVFYMPPNANIAMREFGISLFLACVGLSAGERFVEVLVNGDGVYWMVCAGIITTVPLLIIGIIARVGFGMNYAPLCGLLAGSMTDPPALAFSNTISGSDAPAISYATVYPLTMLLRVVTAQLLVLVRLGP